MSCFVVGGARDEYASEPGRASEVRMTDAVVLAEVRVGRDHLVQPGHPYRDAVNDRFVVAAFDHELASGIVVLRPQVEEGESPPYRYVDRGQGPVRDVHRADEVQVRGQMKRFFPVPRVGEVQRVLGVALVVFEQVSISPKICAGLPRLISSMTRT